MTDEPQIDIVFPDGLVFRAYTRALSIPYGIQFVKRGMGDLMCCGLDAETDASAKFREMDWNDKVQALRGMTWTPEVVMWLVPTDDRSTIGDLLSRTVSDLDLKDRPFTYTEEDWKNAWFRHGWYAFFSANEQVERDRLHALTREEKIAQLNEWEPGDGDKCRDLKPYYGGIIDAVDELILLRWEERVGWAERQVKADG